ncbi:MAG: hypothetical protein ACRDTA_09860, partial [Pseudonocardiaceae bacterium]
MPVDLPSWQLGAGPWRPGGADDAEAPGLVVAPALIFSGSAAPRKVGVDPLRRCRYRQVWG